MKMSNCLPYLPHPPRSLVDAVGANPAIFICYLNAWNPDEDGWIRLRKSQVFHDLGLKPKEQSKIRKKLVEAGMIEVKVKHENGRDNRLFRYIGKEPVFVPIPNLDKVQPIKSNLMMETEQENQEQR